MSVFFHSVQSWVCLNKTNSFGLLPSMEGNSFGQRCIDPCLRHIKQACSRICGILVSSFLQSVQSVGCLEKIQNFFGPLANTESKSLDSALLRLHSDITKKVAYKFGIVWWWFCSDQSSNQAVSPNKKSLGPNQQLFSQEQLQSNTAEAQIGK